MLQKSNYAVGNCNILRIVGNIVPQSWYYEICSQTGKTDHNAISMLAEIVYWYRPSREGHSKFQGDTWQTSYQHFEQKFGYHKQKIRRALVRLEELGFIKRELRTIEVRGQKYSNILFIHLLKNLKHTLSAPCSSDSLSNNTSVAVSSYKDATISFEDKKIYNPIYRSDTPSIQNCREQYIDKENNLRINRSRSESDLNEFEKVLEKAELTTLAPNAKIVKKVIKVTEAATKILKFTDFLPLSQELYKIIADKSCRNYPLNFVNSLLEKLSVKYKAHSFFSQNNFINYMVKVLDNELLSEEMINTLGYIGYKSRSEKEKEYYLNLIEDSKDTSRAGQLKRKIVGLFDSDTAYLLLKKCVFPENASCDDIYKIELLGNTKPDEIKLSENETVLLLKEVRSLFGANIKAVEIEGSSMKESSDCKDYKITIGNDFITTHNNKEQAITDFSSSSNISLEGASIEINLNIWDKARVMLRKKYGIAMDKSWFSSLDAEITEENGEAKEVRVLAPTNFHRDWIKSNCLDSIKEVIKKLYPEMSLLIVQTRT